MTFITLSTFYSIFYISTYNSLCGWFVNGSRIDLIKSCRETRGARWSRQVTSVLDAAGEQMQTISP